MMMAEKDLIIKLRELRQIKPTKTWVSLTKKSILGQEPGITFFPYLKPVFAGFIAFLLLFGTFGFVQKSLPGDILYSLKKISQQSQAVFVSESEKPVFQLQLANDRLEDLAKAPAKNLAPTINEFQANMAEAARTLSNIDATTSDPVAIKKIVEETKKLKENQEKITALGVVIEGGETAEFDAALKKIVDDLIQDLEKRTLNEEKTKILSQMKELFEGGKYTEALELYLTNQ